MKGDMRLFKGLSCSTGNRDKLEWRK